MTAAIKFRGGTVLVDDEDREFVSQWKWRVARDGYARRSTRYGKRSLTVLMHRELVNPSPGLFVDHINGNKLDNRRSNLRVADDRGNGANRAPLAGPKHSRFKGVTLHKSGRWQVQCDRRYRGLFDDEIAAAREYDRCAIAAFGEFARLNFPPEDPCNSHQAKQ